MIAKFLRIWTRMAVMSFGAQLSYGIGSFGFLAGKLIRLFFFFAYIVAIFSHTKSLAGYTLAETVLFFLTYNVVDITAQVFFRGIYGARRAVQDGDLDYYLIQPCPPLIRLAASTVDFLDLVTLVPVLALLAATWTKLPGIGLAEIAGYCLLVLNGVLIALAVHIIVAALAVRTQELENTIWIYRELMFLGRFPVDIYGGALKIVLTVFLPIGVMTSFPAKALLGLLSPAEGVYALGVAAASLSFSLWFWRDALSRYTSVSS
ncbi:MAG: ABC-2 family transporter protein [Elusimicrobia bacterium]|nr:ABC-2 family transporter protein [Elusimicrobiota bacterium]